MTTFTEGTHPGGFLVWEAFRDYTRETITIASGTLAPGTVLGRITASGKYTRYPMEKQWPAYITYFTYGLDVNGELRQFDDIYGRDAPVLAELDAPRQRDRARKTSEEAVEVVGDLQTT